MTNKEEVLLSKFNNIKNLKIGVLFHFEARTFRFLFPIIIKSLILNSFKGPIQADNTNTKNIRRYQLVGPNKLI